MVVATEELSRASLGIGGSLITRPEILTRALVKGGTEAQKQHWLPQLAERRGDGGGGGHRTRLRQRRRRAQGHGDVRPPVPTVRPDYVINGVKTWCTFAARADVLMLLARTDPDRSKAHRGLSLFIVPKPRGDGHGFQFTQDPVGERVGKLEGRPIDTIGYRGMHSYEVALEDWWVPAENLIGGAQGLGRGFYYQMEGLRERPPADGGAGDRRDAGRLRRGPRLRPQPQRVRLERSSTTN